ncbi:MAG TPA: L,D-transpeptidase [Bdellovibrionota bacterium]|nr:L,D-transpeptidase [Bdellovibrionota bacterium]
MFRSPSFALILLTSVASANPPRPLEPTSSLQPLHVPKALPVEPDIVVPPMPAPVVPVLPPEKVAALKLLEKPAEGADYDLPAIREAYFKGLLTFKEIRKNLEDGYTPSEAEVVDSKLLPYQNARIDVFLTGTKLHGIGLEFSVLSVDGQIRGIGLISSGDANKKKGEATPAQRWELYGVDKNRRSKSFNDSWMPYALMLSRPGSKFYSETAFHGTFSGANGYPRSMGCLREITEGYVKNGTEDSQAVHDNWGYHRIVWNALIPAGIKEADHVENFLYGSWYDESEAHRNIIREIRFKTTIFTHNAKSLEKVPGWREALEELYPKALIERTIKRTKKETGYAEFRKGDPDTALDLQDLRDLYEIERAGYRRPGYLTFANEREEIHYDRRHLDWLKKAKR